MIAFLIGGGVRRRAWGVGRGAAGHIKQNVGAACTAKNGVKIKDFCRTLGVELQFSSWQQDSESWGLGVFRVWGFGVWGVLLYFYVPYVARMALFLNLNSGEGTGHTLCFAGQHFLVQ